jgi:ribosomal protein S8
MNAVLRKYIRLDFNYLPRRVKFLLQRARLSLPEYANNRPKNMMAASNNAAICILTTSRNPLRQAAIVRSVSGNISSAALAA